MTLPDQGTVLLYALSTLAQTCAALAAFVGAVGLYRLQSLRDAHVRNERTLRGLQAAATLNPEAASQQTIEELVRVVRLNVRERSSIPTTILENMRRALVEWDAFPTRHRHATSALIIFEAWNLLVILGSLGGFAHVPRLAALWWSGILCWAIALITVGVTGWALLVWIGRYEPVEQTGAAGSGGSGWWQRIRHAAGWINRYGTLVTALVTALATVAIAVLTGFYVYYSGKQWGTMQQSLALTQQSNELTQRAWILVDTITLDGPLVPNTDLRLVITEKNYGKSPASQITTHAGPIIRRVPPTLFKADDVAYQELIDSKMLAGPDKPFPSNFKVRFTDTEFNEIKAGATVYIVGRITYVDPFFEISRTTRETAFCGYVKGAEIVSCPEGNYAR